MCAEDDMETDISGMDLTDDWGMDYFEHADDQHISREKRKARELRSSQWWKNETAKGICYYCHGRFHPSELTMDHIVPIIRGGFTKKGNVVPCCKDCNNKKKYFLPVEWKEYLKQQEQADKQDQ